MDFFCNRFTLGVLSLLVCSSFVIEPVAAAKTKNDKTSRSTSSGSKDKKKSGENDKTKDEKESSSKAQMFVPGAGGVDDDLTVTQGDAADSSQSTGTIKAPDYVEAKGDGRMDVDNVIMRQIRTDAASETYSVTRKNARTMALLIPPPRGLIVDRMGHPLAQNVISYQLVLKYGQFEDESNEKILAYGRRCIADAEKLAGKCWELTDEQLLSHYKYRRWLPLPLTNVLSDEVVKTMKSGLPKGLELLPIYKRHYPQGKTAAHMMGYVGIKGKLPRGPINNMDPLWEVSEGKVGFERSFDKPLTGRPGVWRLMFDEQGNKILDELSVHPKPGGTVVTTLNLKWQKTAEKILAEKCKRGAFVVIDVESGEVLVLASQPSFDPNLFVPNISQKDYEALQKAPSNPLVSRAYQGVYPPASTYKAVVALAGLDNGTISESTIINCPAFVKIGNHVFNNWTKVPEGPINVCRALARSTNPFFILTALRMGGPAPFLSMSRKLGLGQKTGLPIEDLPGTIPDDSWLRKNKRTRFYDGDAANYSIGQGAIEATPLQVAQFMAAIANGQSLPKLHLIKQIQDMDGNVIYAAHREVRNSLALANNAAAIVRKGMHDVVNGGTGSRARLSYTELCGKTGTGQYGSDEKRVGWFAGFLPYDSPRYAFAAIYEGAPHEKVGGSSNAVPMVKEFFETLKEEVKSMITPLAAEVIEDDPSVPVKPLVSPDPNSESAKKPGETPGAGNEVVPPAGPGAPVTPPGGMQNVIGGDLPEIKEIDDSSEGGRAAEEVKEISTGELDAADQPANIQDAGKTPPVNGAVPAGPPANGVKPAEAPKPAEKPKAVGAEVVEDEEAVIEVVE